MIVKKSIKVNEEVTEFLDEIKHPFRAEIEMLRKILLSVNFEVQENIKWNAPNYMLKDEDRITMRIHPPKKQVQLIFHRGAKKQVQPNDNLIDYNGKLLVWKEKDRAVATFNSMKEIELSHAELVEIITKWLAV